MRLKSVYISDYKNLKAFNLAFDGESFLDIFVGKNGTGKSNLFEALTEIFSHLYESERRGGDFGFAYKINYEIDGEDIFLEWENGVFKINGQERKTVGSTSLPDNVVIYYSGHNEAVSKIVDQYKASFRRSLKTADEDDSRRFIGIGSDYKELLLTLLLMQPAEGLVAKFTTEKLGIAAVGDTVHLTVSRPSFAPKGLVIDPVDPATLFWGADGVVKEFLSKLTACIKVGFGAGGLYDRDRDLYKIPIDIEKFKAEFKDETTAAIFRKFDNLKTLEMLSGIFVPIKLVSGLDANTSHFSDGQFQSIYIYALIEIFKDRNCITLLDEPDSFLHPEWQFQFLQQVIEITDVAAAQNHVLMTSHSAVTLIQHTDRKIKFFDVKDNFAHCYSVEKRIAIKKLSSSIIEYSEHDQLLSILNTIQIEKKPILFTEGSTDPIIIKTAWEKLYDEEMPFIPFYAFSCTFIKQLLTDQRIHQEMGDLPMFALYDFDKAYDQWNGLNGDVIVADPFEGMVKKWNGGPSYAFMMPIPKNETICRQVIKNAETGETFEGASRCEIEHHFFGLDTTLDYFCEEAVAGGTIVTFASDSQKTDFARKIVPSLPPERFESFRPMFDFITKTIPAKK
jgi:predicted ATPase